VLIGQGKKFELWDEASWLACRQEWLEEPSQVGGLTPRFIGFIIMIMSKNISMTMKFTSASPACIVARGDRGT
jgi:hypothetical protein